MIGGRSPGRWLARQSSAVVAVSEEVKEDLVRLGIASAEKVVVIPLGFDLQLSGHTHAGQFFPFTMLIGLFHKFSRGLYRYGRLAVYVNPGTSCGSCHACRCGQPINCDAYTFLGYFGFGPRSSQVFVDYPYAGFAEYMTAPATSLVTSVSPTAS